MTLRGGDDSARPPQLHSLAAAANAPPHVFPREDAGANKGGLSAMYPGTHREPSPEWTQQEGGRDEPDLCRVWPPSPTELSANPL